MDADVRAIQLTVNGRRRHRRGRAAPAAVGLPARGPRADRHQPRLRAGRVRLLHGDRRRRDRALVPDVRRPGRRQRGADRRGPGRGRRDAPAADRVLGAPQPAVRLLHARDADDRARVARAQPAARRAGDPRRALGQPVPLHGLPAHRRRHPGRGRGPMAVETRTVGRARHQAPRGPGAADRQRDVHQRLRACPGCCTPRCCAARTRTRASCPWTATAARALEGVVAVLSGAELAEIIDPMPRFCAEEVVQHAVAVEKARYAGEAVAIAVAESRYLAEDALELVEIDYELLEPLVDPVEAAKDGAPMLHENLGTNVVYERTFTHGDVEGDFARAAHVVRRTLRWPRVCASPMEPAGAVCDFDPATGRMEVHSNSNMLNFAAWVLAGTLQIAAGADRLPPDVHRRELRLQAPDGEGDRARRRDVQAHAAPGEVHGGPRGQPAGQRLPGARPPLRGGAGDRRRRPLPVAADRGRRRLRRVLPVRGRRQHEPDGADRSARTRSAPASPRSRPS